MPIYKTLNHDFFKLWSPDMAYVLGYFAADGSMIENKRGAHFIEFTSTDKILLQNVKRVVGSNHKISKRLRPYQRWKQQYRLQFGSKKWFADLSALGLTQNKSNTLHFPKVPNEFLSGFVRGYFEGDGNAWIGNMHPERSTKSIALVTMFTSGSVGFLRTLHSALVTHGIQGGCVYVAPRGYARLQFATNDSLKLGDFMYNQKASFPSALFLGRKKRIFERFRKMRS